ncbi:MAG: hypothetical protein IKP64_04070, partial [Selenomonadaceae bacterium]|nr:hypothetical protein [Selenomonadaceae bacterium]
DDSIKTTTDLLNKLTDAEREAIAAQPTEFFGSLIERVAVLNLELKELNKTAEQSNQQLLETLNQSNKIEGLRGLKGDTSPDVSEDTRKKFDEEWKRTRDYTDELYKITHNEFDNRQFDIDKWYGDLVNRAELSVQEREALDKLYAEKSAQVEQERETKLAEIRDRIAAADRTAFENRLADIEKEKQSWIQAGMDKLEADELAQKKREQLEQEIADKVSDIRQSINAEFQTDLEKEIAAVQKLQKSWVDMGVSASEAAELAGQKMELAFEKAVDKAKTLHQSLEDKIFAQEHSQYENDIRKLQHEVAQKAQEYQKAGLFDENARAKLNRYYNNALRDLNVKATKGGDYTKAPTGANSGFQIVDYSQAQQQAIGLFTKESTSRQSVIKSLDAEQRKRLEEAGVLDKIIDAQNSLADSTEQAAGNIQDASSSIEIIHGDQIGGDLPTVDAPSLDDILAGVIPTNELRELQSQTQEVTNAQGNLTNATENVTSAEKNLSDATNDATTAQKNFAETTEQVKSALKKIAEDAGKLSGSKREDTDVPTKMPTKSAPHDNSESKPEKVQLKVKPKEKELSLEDLGIDYDTFKDILLTGGGIAAGAGATGIGSLSIPAILGGTVLAALAGGVAKGTYDNYQEKQSIPENISLDAGEFANVDLTEISSPLSGIETNVQGIRDILQGRNAVEDANTESLQDTSTENFPDLLTPLTNINETAQSLLQELQSRQDEGESDTAVSELQSEISSRLSESASQITDGITAPIESLSQALSEIQAQNSEQDTAANEGTTYLENVAGTVQRIWDDMQAAKETETADAQGTDDTAAKLANIDTNVAAIWQKLSETTAADMSIDTPQDSGVARLVTIDEKVQGILTTLQDKAASQESPLNTLLEPLQRIDSPLSSIVNAITEKQVEIPTETIVQPLSNIANLIDKILSALSNREPPKVEISPNMDIDLGGAYVFDDNLKIALVNDITSNIVSRITEAVQSATASILRSGGYGFGS